MSDYVKAKVIRLPFPKEILEKCNTDDAWECEDYLSEKLGDLYGSYANGKRKDKYFEIEATDKAYYIDYVLQYSYGEESGDYGFAFRLDEKDIKNYRPLFEKLDCNFGNNDLRKVVYCYYNGCECADYYDISEDIFEEL